MRFECLSFKARVTAAEPGSGERARDFDLGDRFDAGRGRLALEARQQIGRGKGLEPAQHRISQEHRAGRGIPQWKLHCFARMLRAVPPSIFANADG